MATASDWYRDGLEHADIYRAEPRALRALEEIDSNNPELAKVMSRWTWIFDEDMNPYEVGVLEYIADLDEKVPEFVPRIVELPWISDGIDRWESGAVSDLYYTSIHYDLDFAVELATAPWVVDGVTFLEVLFGIGPLSKMSGEHEHGFSDVRDGRDWTISDLPHGPELARQIMSLIDYPPKDIDLYLVSALNTIRRSYPDGFERLLTEPWFVDGLDEEERIYLIAASGTGQRDQQLFELYTIESATIALPHTGDVKLWAVQYGPFPSGQDILAQMEEAVRGSEQFWELPFPIDNVILYLEDAQECHLKGRPECRGKNIGRLMFLITYEGKVSSGTVNHEVAHYYFYAGPSWFTEGGARFVEVYLANDGDVPEIQPSEYCAEQGLDNLQALNDIGGGPLWDSCRYPMGLHFLVALRETMGEEAWLSALRAFYLEFGYEGLHVSTADSPEDEEVYRVFIEHTPPELVDEVRDIFRRLHGGPFAFSETEVSLTPEEMASARLSEIIPWFVNPPDSDHVEAVAALTYIWLRDADLGDTVARLPWLADSVDATELLITRSLRSLVSDDIDIASMVASVAWLADEVTLDEYLATKALTSLVDTDLQLAESTVGLTWFGDDITIDEAQAIKALGVISSADVELAKRILSSPRFADDITRVESGALHALGEIARHDPELALYWGESAINETGDLGLHVLRSIFDFVSLESDSWNRLTGQPWYADGLDDEETAFVTVLGRMATNHPQLYQDLLQAHFTQASTVSLPLAGEVNIWVFQSTPFPANDNVVTAIEDTVRIAEGFMGVPFPTRDVILLIGEHLRGNHLGSFMILPRFGAGDVRSVPHETAHYYFGHSIRGPAWFLEGGAEFIEALVNDRNGTESLGDRRIRLRNGAYAHCTDVLAIDNIWHLNHFDGNDGSCEYYMGEYFLLNVYETIGPEAMAAALRELSMTLLKSDSKFLPSGHISDHGWEGEIYYALLKHTAADRQEEFRKLYLRLHGGPFAFPETEVSNEPD